MTASRGRGVRRGSGFELTGKVALVTGGGVRVGRAIATELGRAGATVAVHYRNSVRGAGAATREIERGGGRARAFGADLLDRGAALRLVSEVVAWGGRLDFLVCSAAGFDGRALGQIDDEAWDRMLDLNLGAPFRLARAAAPHLQRSGGAIVNILDVAALTAWKGFAHYCTAKAGLAMLTRCLALELAPRVRVCGVAPGTVAFPISYGQQAQKRVLERIPLGRVGSPADVARAVRYLATAEYVTGSILAVDGGRLAGMAAAAL